ncbi:MAG: leucine-rich repeat domain-containing protein [Treponema sp.]|nr:leucine-rich repeat domain-containing protein [Treponema sp.]
MVKTRKRNFYIPFSLFFCAVFLMAFMGCSNSTQDEPSDTVETTQFSSLSSLKTVLGNRVQNTAKNPYQITLVNVDMASFSDNEDSLGELFTTFQGRYVALDISTCTGNIGAAAATVMTHRPDADKLVSLILGESTESIGAFAFAGCTALVSISLPASMSTISDSAFAACVSLGFKVTNGNTVFTTDMDGKRLLRDQGKTLVAWPSAVGTLQISSEITTIQDYAFSGAPLLRELILDHNTPPTLGGDHVFENPSDITIRVPREQVSQYKTSWQAYRDAIKCTPDWSTPFTDLAGLGAWVDEGKAQNDRWTPYYAVLKDVPLSNRGTGEMLEDGLRKLYETFHGKYIALDVDACTGATIGFSDRYDQTFSSRPNRDKLVQIILPKSSTSVGIYNFYDCTSLESVTFPSGLKQINKNAFDHCTALKEVELPATLKLLGAYAFRNCTQLKRVIVHAEVPPALNGGVFSGVNEDFSIYVPANSVEAYKSMTGWQAFAGIIKAIE